MSARRFTAACFGAAAIVAAVSGCSVYETMKPVVGGAVTSVTFAANTVLVNQNVPIKEAVFCVTGGPGYECKGSTMSGEPILATAPLTEPLIVTVSVGGKQIFEGSVADVLESNLQVNP